MADQKPSIGRIVHFVLPAMRSGPARHRPAVITMVYSDTCVNLRILFDANDPEIYGEREDRRKSVVLDERGEPHTWHWPEREE